MIEKLTCCLAHPMNALRILKEKINEVIGAHNALVGKVENLPAGGGGEDPAPATPTVILPETTLALNEELGGFMITEPLNEVLAPGCKLDVSYNGTHYECFVETIYSTQPGKGFGNLVAAGMGGGNPAAPFVVLLPKDTSVYHAAIMDFGGATELTLSIIKTADPAPGETLRVHCVSNDDLTAIKDISHSYSEIKVAFDSGKIIYCDVFDVSSNHFVFHLAHVTNTDASFMLVRNAYTVIRMSIAADGTITFS